jgi:hypothetical protein
LDDAPQAESDEPGYTLDEWCAALGIDVGSTLAGWTIQPPMRESSAVVLALQGPAQTVQFWIEPRSADRQSFGYSPSFNLAHRDLPADDIDAHRVIRALAAAIIANDDGDFPPPPYGAWIANSADDPSDDDFEIGEPLPAADPVTTLEAASSEANTAATSSGAPAEPKPASES